MVSKVLRFLPAFALVFLGGCATLFSDTTDTITINATPSDAKIYVDGQFLGQGSATFTAPRTIIKKNIPHVKVERAGYVTQEFPLKNQFDNTAIWNLTFVYSWTTDAVTGAMFEYAPNAYQIQMQQDGAASLPREMAVERFVLVNADRIKADLSAGSGEYLDSLVIIAAEAKADQDTFRGRLHARRGGIIASSPRAMADWVLSQSKI